jgi:hypothetical protein
MPLALSDLDFCHGHTDHPVLKERFMNPFQARSDENHPRATIEALRAYFRTRSNENKRWFTMLALRINGRPVSFARFRRIPCEPIAGECLGWVNYLWGRCARREKRGHLHVLWHNEDGELRRACVEAKPPAGTDREQWSRRYAELRALPQIFIAM